MKCMLLLLKQHSTSRSKFRNYCVNSKCGNIEKGRYEGTHAVENTAFEKHSQYFLISTEQNFFLLS